MRRWIIGGVVTAVALSAIAGTFVLSVRDSTRFDDRAYPGSSLTWTPEETFTRFAVTLPECTDGRLRYWVGDGRLYLKISATAECVSRFVEANRLNASPVSGPAPTAITEDEQAAELGWTFPADRSYTLHLRGEGRVQVQAWTDDAAEQSLYLYSWMQ
ncbi:hypothetical protein ACFQ5G_03190 [Actinoplanes sichuanensis]|uniref:Uncharacterized protein n=1 Tax=Actinoplanes sichuanensis TaxID=512349 RepID=A0ABW4A0X2_9ACTN